MVTFEQDGQSFYHKITRQKSNLGFVTNYEYAYTEVLRQSETDYFILFSAIRMVNRDFVGYIYTDSYMIDGYSLFDSEPTFVFTEISDA